MSACIVVNGGAAICLATFPEVLGVTGKYFHDKKEIRAQRITDGVAPRQRLWDLSEKLAQV